MTTWRQRFPSDQIVFGAPHLLSRYGVGESTYNHNVVPVDIKAASTWLEDFEEITADVRSYFTIPVITE